MEFCWLSILHQPQISSQLSRDLSCDRQPETCSSYMMMNGIRSAESSLKYLFFKSRLDTNAPIPKFRNEIVLRLIYSNRDIKGPGVITGILDRIWKKVIDNLVQFFPINVDANFWNVLISVAYPRGIKPLSLAREAATG